MQTTFVKVIWKVPLVSKKMLADFTVEMEH